MSQVSFDAVRQENAAVKYIMTTYGVGVTTAKRAFDGALNLGEFKGRGYAVSYERAVTDAGTTRTVTVQAA